MRPDQLVALNPLSRREGQYNKLLGREEPPHILEARGIIDEQARREGCTVEDIVGKGFGDRDEDDDGEDGGRWDSSPEGKKRKKRMRTGSVSGTGEKNKVEWMKIETTTKGRTVNGSVKDDVKKGIGKNEILGDEVVGQNEHSVFVDSSA